MAVAWAIGAWANDSWLGMNAGPPNAWRGATSPTTAAITGTATTGITEAQRQAGGLTVIVTIANDILAAAGAAFDAARQDALDEVASTSGLFVANEPVTSVVRISDTVYHINLTADLGYDISATDTITVSVPASILTTSLVDVTGVPSFEVTPDAAPIPDATGGGKGDNRPRYSAKPLGLPPKRKAKSPVDARVESRVDETREIHQEVTGQSDIGTVSERPTEIDLAPVSEMLSTEIDAEIAYWLKRKLRDEDDLRLILLISGSVH